MPCLEFDGIDDYVNTSGFTAISQPDTIIAVFDTGRPLDWGSGGSLRQLFSPTIGTVGIYAGTILSGGGSLSSGVFVIQTAIFNGASSSVYINGLSVLSGDAGTNSLGNVIMGTDGTSFFSGKVAELLVYNSTLSSTDRGNVETYLKNKYAIAGGTPPAPAATFTRKPLKALAATFSPTAVMSKLIQMGTLTRSLASITLGFAGTSLSRKSFKALSATLSFIGNLAVSKTFVRALSATLSFTAALNRKTGKTLIAVLSFTAALTKKILGSGFTATLSFAATMAKNIRKTLTAALSFVGNLAASKLFVRAFTATLSFTGTLRRQTGKALTAALSFIGNLATSFIAGGGHLFFQSYTATMSFVGAFTKLPRKNFAAALSFIAALAKSIRNAGFAATLSFVGFLSTSKAFLKSLSATLSFTGAFSVSKSFLKALNATLSFSGAFSRRAGKAFSATLGVAAFLIKRGAHIFSATLAPVGALVKAIRDAGFSAALSFAGALTTAAVHFFTRSFTATLSFVGNLTRSRTFARALSATLNMTGAIRRQLGKTLLATLSFSATLRRAIRKALAAVLSFAVFFFKGGAVEILAGLVTKCGALIGLAGSTARITKAGSQLEVHERGSGAKIQVTGSNLRVERTK
jgi:hypothetical protein